MEQLTHKSMSTLVCYWQRWLCWSQISTNRRIFASAITVGGFTLLVSLATVVKDIATANRFGTGDALDSFLMAYLLPSFVVTVIAGSFNSAVIPTYIQVRERQGDFSAQELFSSVMIWSIALLLVVSVVLALSMNYIMPMLASGFSAEKLKSTQSLFFVLLPVIVVSGIATIWSSILNAGERFLVGALAPVMVPVAALASLLLFGNIWGIFSLAVGTVVGNVLQCILLAISLKQHEIHFYPHWYGMTPELRKVINQYLPMVGGAFLMSSSMVVSQIMATWLEPGSVSALSYGAKLPSLLVGLSSTAIGTAVFPHLAQFVAKRDFVAMRHTFYTYTKLILLVSIPVTAVCIIFSREFVRLLFEHGSFDTSTTKTVTLIQQYYLLQTPFYILGILLVRFISSFYGNQIISWIAASNFVLNVICSYLLMKVLGIAGIALATSIVYAASTVICYISVSVMLKNGLNCRDKKESSNDNDSEI